MSLGNTPEFEAMQLAEAPKYPGLSGNSAQRRFQRRTEKRNAFKKACAAKSADAPKAKKLKK